MTNPLNAGDVPTEPIIRLMGDREADGEPWTQMGYLNEGDGTHIPGVQDAMPEGTPETVKWAKMRRLYRKGLVGGCLCGCRGDFTLTRAGWDMYNEMVGGDEGWWVR